MKKVIKGLFIFAFVILSIFVIHNLTLNYSDEGLIFMVFSCVFFIFYFFLWVMPKKFFDFCWKFSRFFPDHFDYDTSYSKLENLSIGLMITAYIFLIIGFLVM